MDALTIFERCRNADNDINRMNRRIEQWRETITAAPAIRLDANGGGRAHGGDHDRIGRIVAEIADLEKEIENRRYAFQLEKIVALRLIDDLTELEGAVLYGWYIKHENNKELACSLQYSTGYLRTVKSEVCKKLKAITVDALLEPWYLEQYGAK